MADQAAIERQNKAKAKGFKAFLDGDPLESNPYKKPAPRDEHHAGPLLGAWDAGWYEAEILAKAGGQSGSILRWF
jgi:hypothetical protein